MDRRAQSTAVIAAALLAGAASLLPGQRADLHVEMQRPGDSRAQQLHAAMALGSVSVSLRLCWSA